MLEALGWLALVVLAAFLAGRAVEVIACYGWLVAASFADALDLMFESLRRPAERGLAGRRAMKGQQQLLDWIDSRFGASADTAINREVVEAQAQAPHIKKLIREELPKAVSLCVRSHRIAALAAGVESVRDVAGEPECFQLRERVARLEDGLVLTLERYPLLIEDPALLHDVVVLRRMRSTCGNCPYLNHSAYAAPKLCPTAELAGIEGIKEGKPNAEEQ